MSEENIRKTKRLYEEFSRAGTVPVEFLDDAVRWHPPQDVPEHGTLTGHEAIVEYTSGYAKAFDDFEVAPDEFIGMGDSVVASVRLRGQITGSADPIELPGAQVWTFNERGVVSEVREYRTMQEALKAAERLA